MRILVGWDDAEETELLTMYLEAGENEVEMTRSPEALLEAFRTASYDVVLLPVTFPDNERAFQAFEEIRRREPDIPVIVAARPGEI
jgi:DNA-binding response OmpR family regulator